MSYNGAANLKNGTGPNVTKERVKEDWAKWFAWHPVEINGKKVWLQTVYRRYCYTRIFGEHFSETYEYGNLFDVLKD